MAIAQVYRNLNTGRWSVRQRIGGKWLVVAHADFVALADVRVRQSERARQRVIERRQRDVHCWAYGELMAMDGVQWVKDRSAEFTPWDSAPGEKTMPWLRSQCPAGITYNPYEHKSLVYRADLQEFTAADLAVFDTDQKMYARV